MSYSFASPWTVALQAPLSRGFPRQEYWSGLPFPSLQNFPRQGIEPTSPAWQVESLPLSHLGSPWGSLITLKFIKVKKKHKMYFENDSLNQNIKYLSWLDIYTKFNTWINIISKQKNKIIGLNCVNISEIFILWKFHLKMMEISLVKNIRNTGILWQAP